MNEMQVFQNSEFGELGVLEIEGKPWFPATACARALGYARPADAISAHCKGSVKHRVLTSGGQQEMKFIPEGDLYRLIVHSKLPGAERFEKWVFDEVLPSIRQTGGYGSMAAAMEKMAASFTAALENVLTRLDRLEERQEMEMEELYPSYHRRKPMGPLYRLDTETRLEMEAMLCSGKYTYSEVVDHLAEYGIKTSVTSVYRYAKRLNGDDPTAAHSKRR